MVNQSSLEAISGHDRQGTLRWTHRPEQRHLEHAELLGELTHERSLNMRWRRVEQALPVVEAMLWPCAADGQRGDLKRSRAISSDLVRAPPEALLLGSPPRALC